jgi:hypothetical protein
MNAKSITYRLDLETGIDPYRADTGGLTRPAMWIAVHDNEIVVGVSQEYPGETGENPADRQLIHIAYSQDDDGIATSTPAPAAFETYIRSDEAQALIRRIADGHTIDWPDPDRPGDGFRQSFLDDDAEAARDELEAAIAALPWDKREVWTCDSWFFNEDFDELTAEDIDDLIADPMGGQVNEITLADDPEEFLMGTAYESIAYQLDDETAVSDYLVIRGFSVRVDRKKSGEITRVVSITTPGGHTYEDPYEPTPKTTGGTAPDTSLHLGHERKNWLRDQGGIQPTIHRLIDEARIGDELETLLSAQSGETRFQYDPEAGTWCLYGTTDDGLGWESDDFDADSLADARAQAIAHIRVYQLSE